MKCPNCNEELKFVKVTENGKYLYTCEECGKKFLVTKEQKSQSTSSIQTQSANVVVPEVHVNYTQGEITKDSLPAKFAPISAWGYVGYSILYSVPFIGWIFLIIFAISGDNINRRSFARSYFVKYLIMIVLIIILVSCFHFTLDTIAEAFKS